MFTVEDLEKYEGTKIDILGSQYELIIQPDAAGTWAIWSNSEKGYLIWATPNYQIEGIPFDLQDFKGNPIAEDYYFGSVDDFEKYSSIVKKMGEKLLEGK